MLSIFDELRNPPDLNATTGRPTANASRTTSPNVSCAIAGSIKTSPAAAVGLDFRRSHNVEHEGPVTLEHRSNNTHYLRFGRGDRFAPQPRRRKRPLQSSTKLTGRSDRSKKKHEVTDRRAADDRGTASVQTGARVHPRASTPLTVKLCVSPPPCAPPPAARQRNHVRVLRGQRHFLSVHLHHRIDVARNVVTPSALLSNAATAPKATPAAIA
jgi:hypothetical protein